MKIFIFIEWALFHSQSLCYVINIYIYIVIEGLDGHGLFPSSPSLTILRSAYMTLNTLQQDWLL